MKHLIYISSLIFTILTAVGCSENETNNIPPQLSASITSRYANSTAAQNTNDTDGRITSICAFVCEKGIVKSSIASVENNPTKFTIPLKQVFNLSQSKLYTIANYHLCENIETITEGTSEQELLQLISKIPADGVLKTPVYSAVNSLDGYGTSAEIPVALARNIARFDLKLGDNIKVHNIKTYGFPSSGNVFNNNSQQSSDRTSQLDFTTAPLTQSVVGFFFSYEKVDASTPAIIEIDAELNGNRTLVKSSLREIKRNNIYTLTLKSNHATIESEVTVSDGFEDGDDVTANSPSKNEMTIDPEKSNIPTGAIINEGKNTLHFPYTGGEAIIALTGDFEKEFVDYDGKLQNFKIEKQADSRFKITLPDRKNIIGADIPALVLYFARQGEHSDRLKAQRIVITISNHSAFSFTTVGGIEWMPFNGFSTNNSKYPAFKSEENARNYYRKSWNTFAGKGVQWGPRPGRFGTTILSWAAWENIFRYDSSITYGNLPGINGDIIGKNDCVKWEKTTLPCPEGWRLPSKEEFEKIWPPHGTQLVEGKETEYTTSAGRFKAKIEAIGNKNLVITELATTNQLVFPIAGFRSADGIRPEGFYDYLGWNVGTEAYYWCQTRTSHNVPVVGLSKGKSVINEHNPANWNQVRCIRDNN